MTSTICYDYGEQPYNRWLIFADCVTTWPLKLSPTELAMHVHNPKAVVVSSSQPWSTGLWSVVTEGGGHAKHTLAGSFTNLCRRETSLKQVYCIPVAERIPYQLSEAPRLRYVGDLLAVCTVQPSWLGSSDHATWRQPRSTSMTTLDSLLSHLNVLEAPRVVKVEATYSP